MSAPAMIYQCTAPYCSWSGTTPHRTEGGAACCPQCRATCKSFGIDLEREQAAFERDRQAAWNGIQTRRQVLGEARITAREAQAHQQRAQVQFDAAVRWHYPNSQEVLGARQRLIEAHRELATAKLALEQAETAAGVWGG